MSPRDLNKMNPQDLERLLQESLKTVGESYEPRDVLAAQDEFRRRRMRRRIGWATATGLATTAVVVGAFFLAPPTNQSPEVRQVEFAPIALPDETISILQIDVDESPAGVEVGDDSAWVANASGSVSRVDLDTHDAHRIRISGSVPDDVAISEDTTWVVDDESDTVIPVVASNVGTPIDVDGPSNTDIAASDEGGVFAVAGDELVYSLDEADGLGKHARFDGGTLNDIAIASDVIWVFDGDLGGVGSVSTTGGRPSDLQTITQTGGSGADIAADEKTVWIASPETDFIVVLEAKNLKKIRSIELPVDATWAGIALGENYAWVVADDVDGAVLLRIDTTTYEWEFGDFGALREPYDVAVADGEVWVVDHARDSVFVLPVDDRPAS